MKKDKGARHKPVANSGKGEAELLKGQLARALADYDNFRKRTEAREEVLRSVITAKVVTRFLPVLDQLYEAQKHLKDSGVALTINAFEDSLKAEGIEKIEPKEGEAFTEDLYEAVEVVKSKELSENEVAECVLVGWKFSGGSVIRHAKVKVVKN